MAYTSVKISADSSSYQSQMKSAASQMKVLSAEYTTAATKAKLFGSETDSLKAKAESLTQKITVQKNIVQLNSEQQEKLTKKLSDQKTKQEELKTKIDAAKEAYEKSTAETGKNSEQSKALKDELDKLEKEFTANETAIGKTENALANQTVKTEKSKTALMNMEAELKNVNDQLKDNKLEKFATACDTAGTKMESFGKKMSVVSTGIAGMATAVTKNAYDVENDLMSMQGQLGLTAEETEKLKTVAQNLYTNGFGESLGDCSSAVVTLVQNIKGAKDMSVEQQQTIAEQMMTMSDMFGTENEELARTLTTMKNNGIIDDISEGMDVLTVGFQNGANYSGELLDTMREYSPKFQALGMDAKTAMAYLVQGAQNGAFNLDKVGDAMKEFSIRAVDGSDTTVDGFNRIGLNADEMAKKFAAGGDTASQAFHKTLVALKNMDDPISQNIAGTDLFGTMWEDLGKDTVLSLADIEGGLENVEGATVKAGEQVNNSFSTQLKTQFRELQTSLLPLGNELLRLGKDSMPTVKEVIGDVTNVLKNMDSETAQNVIKIGAVVAAIGPLSIGFGKVAKGISDTVTTGQKFVSGAAKIIAKITAKTAATAAGTAADTAATAATAAHTTATAAATATTGTMTAAQTALNVAMKLCPILMIVGLITGLIAAGVALYKNWDKISAFGSKLWGNIKKDFNNIKKGVTDSFKKSGEAVENNVKKMTNSVKNSAIGKATSTVFKAIHKTVEDNMKASTASAKKNLDEMKSAYQKNGGGIKGIVAATMTGIRNNYQRKYDEINKLTGGKLDIMVQKTREGFKKAANSIAEKVSQAKKNASSFASGVVTEVGKIPGKTVSIGINLVKGLWNGISNMQSWVISKVRGFGNSVLTGLKNFFGIHSPSKVMEEQIGKNLALGVANGITKHKKHAKKSASEMGSEIVKAAKKKLDTYKTYHKMSLKQETEYWDNVRKQIKKGTSARTEADKKYLADKKSLNSQLTKAQKEYAKSEKQINADLKKEIKSLNDEYKNAVKERKDSLLSSFSLFESYDAGDTVSKSDLLVGMQTQVEALNEWERQIATLKSRLGNTELFKTIQEMGVSGLQQVKAINSMTEEELKRYTALYKERQTSAKDEATTELKGTKKSTDDKIAKANKQAQEKLTKAQKTYTDACKKLGVTGAAAVKKTVDGAEKPLTKSLAKIQKNTKKTISTAVSTTKKGATQLKRAMDFKWSLPKLKMPHISVTGGKSPYGIGGKGSVPKFNVEYYKTGGIMTNPTVFGLNGNSWMVGGEAGAEAILPLQEFYQKFSSILDRKFEAVQKAQAVGVTCYTYIDGDEIASRTVTKVDSKMVTDKRKRR